MLLKKWVPGVACIVVSDVLCLGGSVAMAEGVWALDEIVVTARKRAESLQQTPLSIVALDAMDLEKNNITDLVELHTRLPNVNLAGAGGAGTNNASFYIRGLGSGARNSPNSENSVGLYIDDAYYGKTDGAILELVDVERIEVLRGPQGTLFGRNSTAGAIRYITKKPHFEGTEGAVSLALGDYDRRDLKASINLPLSDSVASRWSVASLQRDGYVDNLITGKDLGSKDTLALRGALLADVSSSLRVNLSVDYADSDTTGSPTVATATSYGGLWAGYPFADLEDADNLARYGFTHGDVPTNNYYQSYGAGRHFSKRESIGTNLVFDYEINDGLAFKSATTYRDLDVDNGYDMDGTPAELVDRIIDREISVFTQEFQLSGGTDTIDWVAGVFYLEEEVESRETTFRMVNNQPGNAVPQGIGSIQIVDPHKTTSSAIFGQTTYQLTDSLDITAGLRYTRDEKDQTVLSASAGETFADATLESDSSDSWGEVSGRLSLEWTVSEDVFAFVSYARGFRAGGLADEGAVTLVNGVPEFGTYDPELIDSYEIGVRSDLLDNRLRLNLTAFYMDATDLQSTVLLDPQETDTVTVNAGSAEIYGLEAELTMILSDYISFGLDLGLLETEYKEVPPDFDSLLPIQKGDSLTHAPELSYTANLDVDIPVAVGSLSANINYGWKDDYTMFPAILSDQDAFGLLGFHVTYEGADSDWSVSVFGSNITDEEYANIIMDIGGTDYADALGFRMEEPGRPRELGVRFKYHFM